MNKFKPDGRNDMGWLTKNVSYKDTWGCEPIHPVKEIRINNRDIFPSLKMHIYSKELMLIFA